MKILVGCEFTRTVASAFERAGHLAMSCDLLPAEAPGPHYRGDIMQLLDSGHRWDMAILHPECTKMAVCGNRHHANTQGRLDIRKGGHFEKPSSIGLMSTVTNTARSGTARVLVIGRCIAWM